MSLPFCLILFSGLPGCGKTTLARQVARHFGFPCLAKDRLQSVLRRNGLAQRSGPEGYRLILDLADEQLGMHISTILDGVFPMAGFRNEALHAAHRHQAGFRPIFCFCSDEALWQERMQSRVQYVPDWSPVGWAEVLHLRSTFEPWESQTALFLDAVETPEVNLEKAIYWIDTGKT